MPGPNTVQYQENFIRAVKQSMADLDMDTHADVAEWLGVGVVTIQKIMSRGQAPTVEQGIILCKLGGFNANWLFLNTGEMKREQTMIAEQLKNMRKEIRKLQQQNSEAQH